jgi:predicted nucleic acid-binding protein
MMTTLVIDASVAAQWLVPDNNTAEALLVLQHVPSLVAPELLYAEVANTLWKRVQRRELNQAEGEALLATLLTVPVETYPSALLLPSAWEIATTAGITAYDGLYVALAHQLRTPLVTADKRLYAQAPALARYAQLLWIADVPEWLGL